MKSNAGLAIIGGLLLAVFALGANAATFFQYAGQPGDAVAGDAVAGTSGTLSPPDFSFAAAQGGNQLTISVVNNNVSPFVYWGLRFASPVGSSLAVGAYANAAQLAGAQPGIDIFHAPMGCGTATGRFTVLELEVAPDSTVTKLAVDFVQNCDKREPALYGGVRINSDIPYVASPPVPIGPAFVQLASMPGDYIGRGEHITLTRADGYFFAGGDSTQGAQLGMGSLPASPFSQWIFRFAPAPGQPFGVGTYENAVDFGAPGQPGIDVSEASADSRSCGGATGRFTVLEVEYGSIDVMKLAIDFELHCGGGPSALFGGIRFHSTVPYVQPAIPSAPMQMLRIGPASPLVLVRRGASAHVPQFQVLDQYSHPFPGATVHIVAGSCGTLQGAQSIDTLADANGVVSAPDFLAGQSSGLCFVNETLPVGPIWGGPFPQNALTEFLIYDPSDFRLLPLPQATLNLVASQSFRVGVNVSALGYRLSGIPVTFAASGGASGASVSSLTLQAITDADGNAYADGVAGNVGGNYSIVMSVEGVTQAISVTQSQPPVISLVASPTSITVPVDSNYSINVHVLSNGTALPQVPVTLHLFGNVTASPRFLSADPATSASGDFGATINATADSNAGTYSYEVQAMGLTLTIPVTQTALAAPISLKNLQDMWWSGPTQNGWGMSMIQHGEILFNVIFAYDAQGKPTWFVMPGGAWNGEHTAFSGALYRPRGTPFNSYNASQLVVGSSIGTATIAFSDANSARLDYTIDGQSGFKLIQRELFGPTTGASGPLGDMWWGGPSQNGWGIAILQQSPTIFPIWYTYDASGAPVWFVMPVGTWTSSSMYQGRLYRTTGSPWVARDYDPAQLHVFDAGSFALHFSGDTAQFDYSVQDAGGATIGTGSIPIVKEPF